MKRDTAMVFVSTLALFLALSTFGSGMVQPRQLHMVSDLLLPNNSITAMTGSMTAMLLSSEQQQSKKPIVFCASHGTTGTHFIYRTLCRMGMTSVHFMAYCANYGNEVKIRNLPHPLPRGLQAHVQLREAWLHHDCRRLQRAWKCPNITDAWMEQMHQWIDQVVESGDVDALVDSPYPFFAEYVAQAAERIRGVPPIVIVSERDPRDWASRRREHQMLMCLDNEVSPNLPGPVYFDTENCHKQAQQKGNTAKFIKGANLAQTVGWNFVLEQAASSFARLQASWRARAQIVVDLFSSTEAIDFASMTHTMLQLEPRFRQHWQVPYSTLPEVSLRS